MIFLDKPLVKEKLKLVAIYSCLYTTSTEVHTVGDTGIKIPGQGKLWGNKQIIIFKNIYFFYNQKNNNKPKKIKKKNS